MVYLNKEQFGYCIVGSGELEFEEFCVLASKFLIEEEDDVSTELLTSELKETFRFYDRQGNNGFHACPLSLV